MELPKKNFSLTKKTYKCSSCRLRIKAEPSWYYMEIKLILAKVKESHKKSTIGDSHTTIKYNN